MGSEIVSVLELGVDLAFAFEVDGTTEMWVGRLNQMRRKDKSLMNTPILLDAAKEEGVALVCTWFQQSGDLFEHNAVVDLKSYPAWCCMGVVDLVVVDQPLGDESNGGTAQLYYRFENAVTTRNSPPPSSLPCLVLHPRYMEALLSQRQ